MFAKLGSWLTIRDEEEELEEEGFAPAAGRVVPLEQGARRPSPSVGVFAPRTFGDVTDIADALRARQVVILNLQGADRGLLQRVVDFASGVAYTIDGRIQKLADAIYLVVPAGVDVKAAGLREGIDGEMLDLARHQNGAR